MRLVLLLFLKLDLLINVLDYVHSLIFLGAHFGTNKILVEETIPVSELRKNPSLYFTDRPVAVMSHNHATGYVVGAALFEQMLAIMELSQAGQSVTATFRPSANRLKQIIKDSTEYLENATEEELGHFTK